MEINEMFEAAKGKVLAARDAVVDTAEEVVDAASSAYSAVTSSAGKAYLRQYVDKDVWREEMFNTDEMNALTSIVADRIGAKSGKISYRNYDEEAGSTLGYGGGTGVFDKIRDPRTSIKMTLGKANIVRDGNDIYVADTYDFSGKGSKMRNAPLLDRVDALLQAKESGEVSTYGLLHLAAEMFGASEGNGIPVRVKVGDLESLGLEEEDVDHLEQLADYDGRVKDNRTAKAEPTEDVPKPNNDVVIDTSKAFKRYGVAGGDATLAGLRKAAGNNSISWNSKFIGSDGKEYTEGMRIPRGIKLRVVV